jgi:hypothetical protein
MNAGELIFGKCRVLVYRDEARFLPDDGAMPETRKEGRKLFGLISGQWEQIEVLPWSDPATRVKKGERLPDDHPWAKPQMYE